jgi:hypothetical protein
MSPTSATTIQAILRLDMTNLQMGEPSWTNGSERRGEPAETGQNRVAIRPPRLLTMRPAGAAPAPSSFDAAFWLEAALD